MLQIPDVFGIVADRSVCGKETRICNICKCFFVPLGSVGIIGIDLLARFLIEIEIGKAHKRVGNSRACIYEVISNMREILSGNRSVKPVNNTSKNFGGMIITRRCISASPKLLNLVSVKTKDIVDFLIRIPEIEASLLHCLYWSQIKFGKAK